MLNHPSVSLTPKRGQRTLTNRELRKRNIVTTRDLEMDIYSIISMRWRHMPEPERDLTRPLKNANVS